MIIIIITVLLQVVWPHEIAEALEAKMRADHHCPGEYMPDSGTINDELLWAKQLLLDHELEKEVNPLAFAMDDEEEWFRS